MNLPEGATAILTIYVDPAGQIGVAGPIDDEVAFLDIVGKALLVVAQYRASKAEPKGKILVARPMPSRLPPINGA